MEWTFGLITGGNQENFISKIIDSIDNLNINKNKYEIIIIGNCNINRNNTKVINFNENIKPMWITRKKNMITDLAKFNNIVYLHDYIIFDEKWYQEFEKFGDDWDVCMNSIKNLDETRFRDWVLWTPKFLDYNDHSQIKNMYVSGSYFCAKKKFMQDHKFNEALSWGQGEDVEWSLSIRSFWNYKCNPNSIVKCLKLK
ncbi:MAG: hypothetical protein ACOYMA_00835 [Bacteroidia bacterium]